jgi:hypothetical protein
MEGLEPLGNGIRAVRREALFREKDRKREKNTEGGTRDFQRVIFYLELRKSGGRAVAVDLRATVPFAPPNQRDTETQRNFQFDSSEV